jgi:hypothetical protein
VGFSSATQSVKINDYAESNFRERPEQSNVFADPLLLIKRSEQPSEQSQRSIPLSSRTPSPPRQIAARTPLPPMVLGLQEDPLASNAEALHWNMMRWQVDNDVEAEEALIHYGSAITQADRDTYTDRRRQDASVMKNEYSRQHEHKILRKRLEEQRQRRVFSGLQQADNKRKLRKLHSPVNTLDAQLKRYAPVPMELPQTSREWLAESDKHEKNEEEKSEEMRTIDVVSPKHDRNDEYYFEGLQLFQVQKTNESYNREDRDLAASLHRNAAAAAATAARK